MKIAYFDAPSGVSGDMTVAALLDAGRGRGLKVERLAEALAVMPVGGYRLTCETVEVGPMRAQAFRVVIDEEPRHHRNWATIRGLIEDAGGRGLAPGVVERSLRVFEALAAAEAEVHGVEPERVHFHEVGAIDSIVDIVGASWCLDELGVEACFVGPLPSGSGYVDTQHGRLPVPAPATTRLLAGFDVVAGDGDGELVTPTGAAILKALARPARPAFTLATVGCGAGTLRLADRPNVLRVFVGEADAESDDQVFVVEADVDDMTPAALAHVADRLRADGARDVSVTTSHMKKGRAGMRLTVLSDLGRLDALAARILAETSTIGLRYRCMGRVVLPRRLVAVETDYGTIMVKVVERAGGETAEPEFDDVARAALAGSVAFETVRDAAMESWATGRVRENS